MPAIKRLLTSYLPFLTTLNLSEIEIHETSFIDLHVVHVHVYISGGHYYKIFTGHMFLLLFIYLCITVHHYIKFYVSVSEYFDSFKLVDIIHVLQSAIYYYIYMYSYFLSPLGSSTVY